MAWNTHTSRALGERETFRGSLKRILSTKATIGGEVTKWRNRPAEAPRTEIWSSSCWKAESHCLCHGNCKWRSNGGHFWETHQTFQKSQHWAYESQSALMLCDDSSKQSHELGSRGSFLLVPLSLGLPVEGLGTVIWVWGSVQTSPSANSPICSSTKLDERRNQLSTVLLHWIGHFNDQNETSNMNEMRGLLMIKDRKL